MNTPFDDIEETFEIDLPLKESLDSSIDAILRDIRPLSEDLREQKFYVMPGGKPWMEIRDDPGFQEAVLHFFNEGGEYLQSVDGNVSRGKWRLLEGTNKIMIEQGGNERNPGKSELFELAYLDARFFILRKHGNQFKKGRKYFFMGFEPLVRGLKWKDCVDLLYNEFRSQWGAFQYVLIIAVIIVIAVVLFTVL